MTDLPDFLLARITEDETIAHRAAEAPGDYRGHPAGTAPLWTVSQASAFGHDLGPRGSVEATPGRVLADSGAKRRIVELHKPYRRIFGLGCDACLLPRHLAPDVEGWPCETIRLLALPYADHPDYRDEWRP